MYLGDNLLRDGMVELVEAFRSSEPDALILLTPVDDPSSLRRRRARRRPGQAAGREAEGPSQRPRAGRRLHVRAAISTPPAAIEPSARGELEITDAIQALIDDGKRVEPHIVARLVEGHRPARGHARGQPPGARGPRDAGRRELIDSGSRAGSSIEEGAQLERTLVRGRRSSAPARASSTPTSAPTPRSTATCRSPARRSSTRSSSRARASATCTRAWRRACWARTSALDAQRRDAEDAAVPGRRQRRDRDPVKVLVTGRAACSASDVVSVAAGVEHEVVALTHDDLDVTDPARVERLIDPRAARRGRSTARPGPTSTAPRRTRRGIAVNGEGAGYVAAAAAKVGAKVVYVSTDYVFDGAKKGPYLESDEPTPLRPTGGPSWRASGRRRWPTSAASSSAPPGSSARRRQLRRDDAAARRGAPRRCWSSTTRSAPPPTRGHLAIGLGAADRRRPPTASTTWPARAAAPGTSSRSEIFARRGSSAG